MKQMTSEKHQKHGRDLQISSPPASSSNLKKNHFFMKLNRFDVLLGRGSEANEYQGNRNFRNQVNKLKDEYSLAKNREQKKKIILSAIMGVTNMGGRFVKKVGRSDNHQNVYGFIDMETVFKKTRQAIHYSSRRGTETDNESFLVSNKYLCSTKAPHRQAMPHSQEITSTTGRYGETSFHGWDPLRCGQRQSLRFSQPTCDPTVRTNEAILQRLSPVMSVACATARNNGLQKRSILQDSVSTFRNAIGICGPHTDTSSVNQLILSYPWTTGIAGPSNVDRSSACLPAQQLDIVSSLNAIAAFRSDYQTQHTFY